jgi:hypothetical protein
MARWRLTEPHYLNTPGTVWEQKETDRFTGKQVRKTYPVPQHLDPKNESDWNYKFGSDEGEGIVVCYEGKGKPRDIVFVGPPTPAMEPLDDEARDISDGERPNWKHPIEDMSDRSYSEGLLDMLQAQFAEASSRSAPQVGPSPEMSALLASMNAMVANQTKLIEALSVRRV